MLRVFVLPTAAPEFWTEKIDRSSYLREVFSIPRTFNHRGDTFAYVFSEFVNDRIIVGRVGRETAHSSHAPPEEGLVPMVTHEWTASAVLIDSHGGPDGQIVYVEHNHRVGLPIAMMRSLCEAVNESRPAPPWTLSINTVSDESDFWHTVEHFKGSITEINFVFIPPNMFGISDSLDEELKLMQDEEQIDQLQISFRNKAGKLNARTKRVERAMEEVKRGSARATIRSRRRKIYDSDSTVKKLTVDKAAASNLLSFISSVFGLLSRR